jgi:hypothetical protein
VTGKKYGDEDISRLEQSLAAAFRPVAPRPEYKAYLHDRLVIPPSELIVRPQRPSAAYMVLAALGVMGSVVLLIAAIKALVMFTQARRAQVNPRSL